MKNIFSLNTVFLYTVSLAVTQNTTLKKSADAIRKRIHIKLPAVLFWSLFFALCPTYRVDKASHLQSCWRKDSIFLLNIPSKQIRFPYPHQGCSTQVNMELGCWSPSDSKTLKNKGNWESRFFTACVVPRIFPTKNKVNQKIIAILTHTLRLLLWHIYIEQRMLNRIIA